MGEPPVKIETGDIASSNAFQGCCATINASGDSRVIFNHSTKKFEPKSEQTPCFNFQCCIFGREAREARREEREASRNEATHNKLKKRVKKHYHIDLEDVLVATEIQRNAPTDPMTVDEYNLICAYAENHRKQVDEAATSQIMTAATLKSAPAVDTVHEVAKKSGVVKKNKKENSGRHMHVSKSVQVPPIAHWDMVEDTKRRQQIVHELVKKYESVSAIDVERIILDVREYLVKEEEKIQEIEELTALLERKLSDGEDINLSELVAKFLEANEELKAKNKQDDSAEWPDVVIGDVKQFSARLERELEDHKTRRQMVERVHKKLSASLMNEIPSGQMKEILEEYMTPTSSDTPTPLDGKRESAVEFIVVDE